MGMPPAHQDDVLVMNRDDSAHILPPINVFGEDALHAVTVNDGNRIISVFAPRARELKRGVRLHYTIITEPHCTLVDPPNGHFSPTLKIGR